MSWYAGHFFSVVIKTLTVSVRTVTNTCSCKGGYYSKSARIDNEERSLIGRDDDQHRAPDAVLVKDVTRDYIPDRATEIRSDKVGNCPITPSLCPSAGLRYFYMKGALPLKAVVVFTHNLSSSSSFSFSPRAIKHLEGPVAKLSLLEHGVYILPLQRLRS